MHNQSDNKWIWWSIILVLYITLWFVILDGTLITLYFSENVVTNGALVLLFILYTAYILIFWHAGPPVKLRGSSSYQFTRSLTSC